MRWKCICAYDGTDYAGWQLQAKGEVTIQGTLERRLEAIFKHPIRIHGSGRTDTGVHAAAQVFHFDADWNHPSLDLFQAFRSALPKSLQILSIEPVSHDFHARFSATGKHYTYYLYEGFAPVFENRYYWSLGRFKLNLEAMHEAAQKLIGTHDFSAFATNSRADEKEDPVKNMWRLDITRLDGPRIRIDTEASGYMYKMVRAIVGGLFDIGIGKLTPQDISTILESKQRTYIIQTAPAQGLRLMRVFYE